MSGQEKILIIAEAGVNHNGDLTLAKKLVDAAADAGADFVKFQTFSAEDLVGENAPLADYQKLQVSDAKDQKQMLKKLELGHDDHHVLIQYCHEKKIKFFSTAFDFKSLDFLKSLQLGMWKIPSGEITNYPYLRKIGSMNEKTLLSTGMASLVEVEEAVAVLLKSGLEKRNLCVLHCHTEYPTEMGDVNLRAMVTIQEKLHVQVGYSDHTLGIEVPTGAVALGAVVIEKHLTLSRQMDGPDHKASLEPNEFKDMVQAIRKMSEALGSDVKAPTQKEERNKLVARKSLFASRAIAQGEVFSENNITSKRPGHGVSPMVWEQLIGKISQRSYQCNEMISEIELQSGRSDERRKERI